MSSTQTASELSTRLNYARLWMLLLSAEHPRHERAAMHQCVEDLVGARGAGAAFRA